MVQQQRFACPRGSQQQRAVFRQRRRCGPEHFLSRDIDQYHIVRLKPDSNQQTPATRSKIPQAIKKGDPQAAFFAI
jgi:hypothetical protein